MSNFLQDSYKISIEASPHQFWMSLAWPRFLSNFPVILPSNYLGHEKNVYLYHLIYTRSL